MASEDAHDSPVDGPRISGVWTERARVATHFHDVLMRFRLHALVGLGAIAAIAGVLIGRGGSDARCTALSWLLVALAAAWAAVAVLDLFYYRKLRFGAVQAMVRLEEDLPEGERLSTTIERYAGWGARWAPPVFYGLILGVLGAGLRWSQADSCSAGRLAVVAPPPVATPAVTLPPGPRFKFGECVMADDATARESIVKVVGVTDAGYRVFTHALAAGQLVRAEDYRAVGRAELEGGRSRVECPASEPAPAPTKVVEAAPAPRRVLVPMAAHPAARPFTQMATQRPRPPRPLAPVSPMLW